MAGKSWGRLNDWSLGCGIHQRPPQHMGPVTYLCQNTKRWTESIYLFPTKQSNFVSCKYTLNLHVISIILLANHQKNRRKYFSVPALYLLQQFYKIQSQINYKHQCFVKQKRQQFSSLFQIHTLFPPVISWLKILMFPPLLVFSTMILPLLSLLPFTGNNISFFPLFKHPTLQMSRIQKKAHLLTESKHA